MKATILAVMMCAMAACAVEHHGTSIQEETVAPAQGLICNPCDPAGVQQMLDAMANLGGGFGAPVGPAHCYGTTCSPSGPWEPAPCDACSNTYVDDGGHHTQVNCNDVDGPRCWWWNCGDPDEPACHN